MRGFVTACSLSVLALGASPPALAQASYSTPKTPWGAPDIQGVWTNASVTKLTRPAGVDHLVLTPEEAAKIEARDFNNARTAIEKQPTDQSLGAPLAGKSIPNIGNYNAVWVDPGSKIAFVKGEYRSSYIIDPPNGRVPLSEAGRRKLATWRPDASRDAATAGPAMAPARKPVKAKAKSAAAQRAGVKTSAPDPKAFVDLVEAPRGGGEGGSGNASRGYLGPESRGTGERCITMSGGPVMLNGLYNNNFQIVQTPDFVTLEVEMIHDTRIVRLVKSALEADKARRPAVMERWLGDSVGWYEGDTLVIQTKNFNRQQQGQVVITDTGTLTERITRVGASDILYEFTVDDPEVYSQVWKGEEQWRFNPNPIYEYACHEGNYGLYNILSGAREQERTGRKLETTGTEE